VKLLASFIKLNTLKIDLSIIKFAPFFLLKPPVSVCARGNCFDTMMTIKLMPFFDTMMTMILMPFYAFLALCSGFDEKKDQF
jgi:hypothetical protein